MGTHQQLTTEQVGALIIIDEVNKFIVENPSGSKYEIEEIINSNGIIKESGEDICEMLKHYKYIESDKRETTGYALTLDGKQYIKLFEEYLEVKKENSKIEHTYFSLINIEKLQFSLIEGFKVLGIEIEANEIMELAKGILDSISSIVKRFKKA